MSAITLNTILVIRLSSIGDIILTTPFLRVMKARHPGCRVHFAVRKEFISLLAHNPHIDRIIPIDTSLGRNALRTLNIRLLKEGYDAVFDLHNNFRSRTLRNGLSRRIHIINKRTLRRSLLVHLHWNTFQDIVPVPERYIETAHEYGIRPDIDGPKLFPTEDEEGNARLKLRAAGWNPDASTIGLCPGAKHATKRWPEDRAEGLVRRLLENGHEIIIFGSESEASIGDRLRSLDPSRVHNCSGRLTLLETAAAMQLCTFLITNDSGLMHMGTAVSRPVIALFGSTVREFGFFPYNSQSIVVEADNLSCRPCTHIGRPSCPKKHFACMRNIEVDHVLSAIDEIGSQQI